MMCVIHVFMAGVGAAEIGLLLLFFLIPTILWFWALIDVVQGNFSDSNAKIMWVLIIILLPVLGSILYLIIGRKQKTKV